MNNIKFKYHIDPLKTGVLKNDKEVVCECCNKMTNVYYDGPIFSESNICYLCPNCIKSGKAHNKFNCDFFEDWDTIDDNTKTDELRYRTPGIITWQSSYWLSHCNDYCAFVDYVGWNEIVDLGIEKEIEEDYSKNGEYDIEEVKKYLENYGSMQGYLFKCLHCGKYRLWIDCE